MRRRGKRTEEERRRPVCFFIIISIIIDVIVVVIVIISIIIDIIVVVFIIINSSIVLAIDTKLAISKTDDIFFFSDPKLHLTPLPTPPFQYVPHFNCWASDWLVCFLETFWVYLRLFMVWQSLNVKEDLQYKFVSSSVSLNVMMEKMMAGAQMLIGDAINSECSWFLNMHPSWFLNMHRSNRNSQSGFSMRCLIWQIWKEI